MSFNRVVNGINGIVPLDTSLARQGGLEIAAEIYAFVKMVR